MEQLTHEERELILQSLEFTRQAFERYEYPTEEFKQKRLKELAELTRKVRSGLPRSS